MVKNAEFQKELKEKIKPGVKASDLKKLKRSKSVGDIPSAPTSPTTKIKDLESQISVLELKLETKDRELIALETENKQLKNNPPHLLTEPNLADQLDTSLEARHQNLKDWFNQYSQNKVLDSELKENINEASEELVKQDDLITDLRTQNTRLQQTNQSLQKDLNLATKLAQSRKVPLPANSPESNYWQYVFYSLITVTFISLLNTSWKVYQNE